MTASAQKPDAPRPPLLDWRWVVFSAFLVFVFMTIAAFPFARAKWLARDLGGNDAVAAELAERTLVEVGGRAVFLECLHRARFSAAPERHRAIRVLGELGIIAARDYLQSVVDNAEEDEETRALCRVAVVKIDQAQLDRLPDSARRRP
mgnify:CR=1 FL=1